jgi:hypothetical protein
MFHRREYFMGANILDVCGYFTCKQIFLGMRRYFKRCAYVLIGSEYFNMRRYFEMWAYIFD